VRGLHFDCFSGISGDMTLAALLDAGVDAEAVRAGLASLGLPIRVEVDKVRKGGFAATQVAIEAPEEHVHRHLPDVEEILNRGQLTPAQRELALRIFRRLAEAEAAAHGIAVEKVHFHEVGALDSIADIAGVALALNLLGVERITSRSVPTGCGTVQCAHGLMPIPAPATAALLKGIPLAPSTIKAELTTPTGAAILATVVDEWIEQPVMTIERIGHGAGQRDFLEQPNLLRVFVGEMQETANAAERDRVWMLETNLDDVPAEIIGYCFDQLFAAGALDVFTTPIQMKKNRPGVLLSVLAAESALPLLEAILFRETETFGIRRYPVERSKLRRETVTVETPWGPMRGKRGWRAGVEVFTPEYDDCAQVARQHGIALREVYRIVRQGSVGLGGTNAVGGTGVPPVQSESVSNRIGGTGVPLVPSEPVSNRIGGTGVPPVQRDSAFGGTGVPPVQRDSAFGGTGVPPVQRDSAFGGTGVPPVQRDSAFGGTGVPPVQSERIFRRHLPHWQKIGAVYFLTWRCVPSLTLDDDERDVVLAAIRHWDSIRWEVFAAVVMPDHVHVLARPLVKEKGVWDLQDILHSVKSYSAHQINKRRNRHGPLWQDERYDRWMRDEDEFAEKWQYIAENPVKNGLATKADEYKWLYLLEEIPQ
jgi:uncharacterized protein (TIGR00299 family) protein